VSTLTIYLTITPIKTNDVNDVEYWGIGYYERRYWIRLFEPGYKRVCLKAPFGMAQLENGRLCRCV
jgi:hypothetical protein